MIVGKAARALALAAAVALGAAGCASAPAETPRASGAAVVSTPSNDGWTGAVLDQPYAKPTGVFTDTTGARYDWQGSKPVTIVFFGYTHCPDICNTVMADVASALRRVEPSVRSRTEVVFVTTDPERDTAPVIREWLDRFDPTFTGLTATMPTIERAAAGLGVAVTGKEPAVAGGYEVGHGTQLIGFAPDGRGRVVWVQGTPVGGLRADISRLAAG